MGLLERIKDIEFEIARTQKNKATEYHLGRLKAQLAKYRSQIIDGAKKSGGPSEGFDVQRSGDARIALIGYPSVGKSTLLNNLTSTVSETASYEFTTLTCVPGVINYKQTKIQLLDLPGIIEGAGEGKGRGRQVIAVARSADLILMILDSTKSGSQIAKLENELSLLGIRLNQQPPRISIRPKSNGGIVLSSTVPLTKMNEKICQSVLFTYKIMNADVIFSDDYGVEELIDVMQGNRKYLNCIYVYNKIDMLSLEQLEKLSNQPNTICISCDKKWNLDGLLEAIWECLNLVRIYTKKPGDKPDLNDPIILTFQRTAYTVRSVLPKIHTSLTEKTKSAFVWGKSVKTMPQQVGLDHVLADQDVIQLIKNA